MARKDPFAREVRLYTVTVPATKIGPHVVEERVYERFGACDKQDAIRQAVYWSAMEFGVGPWRPSLREMCRGVKVETDVQMVR